MGGLIARDIISNQFYRQTAPTVVGLITLGTPNLGYPYDPVDTSYFCPALVQGMDGGWYASTQAEFLSTYLQSLISSQAFKSTIGSNGAYWMAAAGQYCSNTTRLVPQRTAPDAWLPPTEATASYARIALSTTASCRLGTLRRSSHGQTRLIITCTRIHSGDGSLTCIRPDQQLQSADLQPPTQRYPVSGNSQHPE